MVPPWPGRDEETGFETKKLTKEEKMGCSAETP